MTCYMLTSFSNYTMHSNTDTDIMFIVPTLLVNKISICWKQYEQLLLHFASY